MFIRRLSSWLIACLVLSLSGCSLLEVKIDSQTVPLTKQELNMRIMTREYAQQFFAQVEQAADVLQDNYEPNDKVNQSYILLWKINAEEGLQAAAYQVSPMAALIDTWVFTHQMDQFFSVGAGKDLFTTGEAQQVSAHLAKEVDKLAQSLLKKTCTRQPKCLWLTLLRNTIRGFEYDPYTSLSSLVTSESDQ